MSVVFDRKNYRCQLWFIYIYIYTRLSVLRTNYNSCQSNSEINYKINVLKIYVYISGRPGTYKFDYRLLAMKT